MINDDATVFVYKLVADNGGAPCVYDGKLSLCICKPRIRVSAKVNDWIIGFGGKSVHDLKNKLIYIAKVTERIEGKVYYSESEYIKRPDCIYKWGGKDFSFKTNEALFHDEDSLEHDLGAAPLYDRAICLISDEFVYLGDKDVSEYSDLFNKIQAFYDSLPRDYLKNIDESTRTDLIEFIETVKERFPYGKHGEPNHKNNQKQCDQIEDELVEIKKCH